MTTPSARERFTPHELSAAYEDYTEHGPQYVNVQTGHRAAAYRFDVRRVLLAWEEPETGVVMLATLDGQAAAERASEE